MAQSPNDKRFFIGLIIGFFLVVFAVNVVFMVFAFRSHPGVETENAYEKGLNYNSLLAQAQKAKDLGWTYSLETNFSEARVANLVLGVSDATGNQIQGLKVRGKAFWPVQEGFDQIFNLNETSPGVYSAAVPLALEGQWDLRFILLEGEEPKGHFSKRVLLK